MKGTYILVIYMKKKTKINVGALGSIHFKKGFYFYVGSAMGSSGSASLVNRVKRHISLDKNKKIHWHIDYLLENENSNIIKIILIPSAFRLECMIAQELLDTSDSFIEDFGSSDCFCKSHLIYFNKIMDLSTK
jgi:Uri superfamily endonuclease